LLVNIIDCFHMNLYIFLRQNLAGTNVKHRVAKRRGVDINDV
jgi:hypothetical protein